MLTKSILVWIYALIVLVGGIMGFVNAHSIPSLVTSLFFSSLLGFYGYMMNEGKKYASSAIMGLLAILLLFFGTRFFNSGKFIPGGLMALLTLLLLGYMWVQCGCCCCPCPTKRDDERKDKME